MRIITRMFRLLAICLLFGQSVAQSRLPTSTLCDLQLQLGEGEHRTVQVEGVYLDGMEGSPYLVAAGCSGRSTVIEFSLRDHRHWRKLRHMWNKRLDETQALVIFEGEFYGPPLPDSKLPEALRKVYHPAWGMFNNGMTKLVVYSIRSVKALPADHPCAPPKTNPSQWPCFQNDPLSHKTGSG